MPSMKTLSVSSAVTALLLLGTSITRAEVIFSENFDEQPDFDKMMDPSPSGKNSRARVKGDLIPDNWDLLRSESTWAPSRGYTDRHESFEIKAADSAKARGGTGKAMVNWRDSHDPGWKRWNSDGILLKKIGDQKQVYVEFYIAFSPETYTSYANNGLGTSKIFRIYGFTGDWNDPFNYFAGATHPEIIWSVDGQPAKYGLRNKISTYGMNNDEANYPDIPGGSHGGDHSLSYQSDLDGMGPDGTDAKLPDKKNGGYITSGGASMEKVFGPPGSYTKVAFFVKLNSKKGAHDGVLTQWIDGTQILHTDTLNWVPTNKDGIAWNVVGLGGNDFFQSYPNEDRHEEWYAIDDVTISTTIPDDVESNTSSHVSPNPPSGINVE